MLKIKKSISLLVTLILVFVTSISIYAKDFNKVTKILQEATEFKAENGELYNIIVIPEEELQDYLDAFNSLNSNTRNSLPNLVTFSYTKTSYSVTMKATNIAVDSLDFLSGHIEIYDKNGTCGSSDFSFYNIPPLKSDYVTTRSEYGAWDAGIMFARASDGLQSNSGTFYFSK